MGFFSKLWDDLTGKTAIREANEANSKRLKQALGKYGLAIERGEELFQEGLGDRGRGLGALRRGFAQADRHLGGIGGAATRSAVRQSLQQQAHQQQRGVARGFSSGGRGGGVQGVLSRGVAADLNAVIGNIGETVASMRAELAAARGVALEQHHAGTANYRSQWRREHSGLQGGQAQMLGSVREVPAPGLLQSIGGATGLIGGIGKVAGAVGGVFGASNNQATPGVTALPPNTFSTAPQGPQPNLPPGVTYAPPASAQPYGQPLKKKYGPGF